MLEVKLTLRETLHLLRAVEKPARSRFKFGSPCKLVRSCDVAVHIILPELIEKTMPALSRYLRVTSPRWGRSWRSW